MEGSVQSKRHKLFLNKKEVNLLSYSVELGNVNFILFRGNPAVASRPLFSTNSLTRVSWETTGRKTPSWSAN